MTGGGRARAAMTAEEVTAFIAREFPQVNGSMGAPIVEAADARHTRVRLVVDGRHLRPGGTVSGPVQFYLVDLAAFIAVLVAVGPVGLAVTTSANINFLKKPAPTDLIAETRILKRGKRLVVIDCLVTSDGDTDPVAHAVLTYSIPQVEKSAVS